MTEEQKDVIRAIRSGKNAVVNSVAGSGKTTVATTAIRSWKNQDPLGKVTYMCFNRSIREEMDIKLENSGLHNGKATTMHSLGMNILKATGKRVTISQYKSSKIRTEMLTRLSSNSRGLTTSDRYAYLYYVVDLLDFARYNYATNFEFGPVLDMYQEMQSTINFDKYKYSVMESLFYEFVEIYKEFTFPQGGRTMVIDFADMIFLPVFLNLKMNIHSKYLVLDEIQDFNATQHRFIKNIIRDSGIKQFLAVGDSKQSIYGFAGSDPRLIDQFKDYPNVEHLTISYNFRCGRLIIDRANEVFNNLKAFKKTPGEVRDINCLSEISNGSLVLGRKTSTMLRACFRMLGMNKAVYIKGEDVLPTISRVLNIYHGSTLDAVIKSIERKLVDASDPVFGNVNEAYNLKEDMATVKALANYSAFSLMSKKDIIDKIKDLTERSEEEGAIMICSIHRSKGLEEDEVTILNVGEIAAKPGASAFQIEQELNLKYVALTRAKNVLNFINV